jgi:hypothetical protein
MRAKEFIKEAQFKKSLRQDMIDKGYKFLGQGQEQDAYLEPKTGLVLKIFGTGKDSTASKYTKGQQSFIDFADFCMKNQGNPFLPQFFGWERFEYAGKYYLQIRVERMFPFNKAGSNLEYSIEKLADAVASEKYKTFNDWLTIKERYNSALGDLHQLISLLGGEKECQLFWNTIASLNKIAKAKSYVLDLHQGNFMLGEDGQIIISDPFYAGGGFRGMIKEADFSPSIQTELENKGYELLGHGQDQDAYLEPGTGMILKIFGTGNNSNATTYTKGQKSFIDFANFCMQNPNNPFLPYFDGWERFLYDGQFYLQIRMERLFEVEANVGYDVAEMLEKIADTSTTLNSSVSFSQWMDSRLEFEHADPHEIEALQQIVTLLGGEEECELFWNTCRQLQNIADSKGYRLDLHSGNFMMGSDGEIVIVDPFWTYSNRTTI